MKTTVEVLREARRLIAEQGWTQGMEATDSSGRPVDPLDPAAASFCSIGAIRVVGAVRRAEERFALPQEPVRRLAAALRPRMRDPLNDPVGTVGLWNDWPKRQRADVLAAFDRAIAAAEQDAAQ